MRISDPIAQAKVGMPVIDSDGEIVGDVQDLKMGDPEAITTQGQQAPGGLMDDLRDVVVGTEPDVHPQRAAQLLRTGYLKVDARGLFARDLYVGPEQIDHVDSRGVALVVPRSQLNPED